MKFAVAAVVAFLAAASQAAPAAGPGDPYLAKIKFEGADDQAFYYVDVPATGQNISITNPLSVSHIVGDTVVGCTFYGIDGSVTSVAGAYPQDVGPPQTQISGNCHILD